MSDLRLIETAGDEVRRLASRNTTYEITRHAYENAFRVDSLVEQEMQRLVEADPLHKFRPCMEGICGPLAKISQITQQLDGLNGFSRLSGGAKMFDVRPESQNIGAAYGREGFENLSGVSAARLSTMTVSPAANSILGSTNIGAVYGKDWAENLSGASAARLSTMTVSPAANSILGSTNIGAMYGKDWAENLSGVSAFRLASSIAGVSSTNTQILALTAVTTHPNLLEMPSAKFFIPSQFSDVVIVGAPRPGIVAHHAMAYKTQKYRVKFEMLGIVVADQFLGLEQALKREDAERVRHACSSVRALCLEVFNQYANPRLIQAQFSLLPDPARGGRAVTRRQQVAYMASGGVSIASNSANDARHTEFLRILDKLSAADHVWDGSSMAADLEELVFEALERLAELLEAMLKAKTIH